MYSQNKISHLQEWAADFLVKCQCQYGNIATFVCLSEECTDHAQLVFCFDCIAFNLRHKSHDKTSIHAEISRSMQDWH